MAATHFNCIVLTTFLFVFFLQKFPKELPVFLRDTQNKLYVPCLRSLSINLQFVNDSLYFVSSSQLQCVRLLRIQMHIRGKHTEKLGLLKKNVRNKFITKT